MNKTWMIGVLFLQGLDVGGNISSGGGAAQWQLGHLWMRIKQEKRQCLNVEVR